MWDEADLANKTPEGVLRYALYTGKFVPGDKSRYQFHDFISSSSNLETIRNRAARHFRLGRDLLLVDTQKPALIGNLWAIKEELK